MDKNPITLVGFEAMKAELKELKTVARPQIILEVATARAHGDLKENAEYHAARDKQSFIEGRIQVLDDKIARAQVIDTSKLSTDKVVFGMRVTLIDVETETERSYHIVGDDEADLKKDKISISAPISKALIGKSVDDEVTVVSPGGKRNYVIVSIDRG